MNPHHINHFKQLYPAEKLGYRKIQTELKPRHSKKQLECFGIDDYEYNLNKIPGQSDTTIQKNVKNYRTVNFHYQRFQLINGNNEPEMHQLFDDHELRLAHPNLNFTELNQDNDDNKSGQIEINNGIAQCMFDLGEVINNSSENFTIEQCENYYYQNNTSKKCEESKKSNSSFEKDSQS